MDDITHHYRSCSICEAMCGLEIKTRNGQILSIRGDRQDPHSKGHICPKATAIKDLYEDPDRLKKPVKRTKNGWRQISWTDAFEEIRENFQKITEQYGRDAVAIYRGNPMPHYHGNIMMLDFLIKAAGSVHVYSADSVDQFPLLAVCYHMFGHKLLFPLPDIDRTDYFLIIGANPVISGGSIMSSPGMAARIKSVRSRGGKVVVLDPVYTKTAKAADRHYFIKPGTDVLLLMGILKILFEENLIDLKHLDPICDGLKAIGSQVQDFSLENASKKTGIREEDMKTLAREFAAAKKAVCYGRMGTSVQEYGTLATWLILVLNIVTGKMDRPGGCMFSSPVMDLAASMDGSGELGRYHTKVRKLPDLGGEFPVATLAEDMLAKETDRIRGFICLAGNPVLSAPNGRLMDMALKRLDFMVAMDWYVTETSRHAHIILPPTHMLEHHHYPIISDVACIRNTAKYSPPVFEPDPDARHGWQIIRELAICMTKNSIKRQGLKIVTPERLLKMGIRFGPYGAGLNPFKKGLTLKKISGVVHGLDLGPMVPRLPERLFTDTKKIQLAPQIFVDGIRNMEKKLHGDPKEVDTKFDLLLISRRNIRSNNSWFHNLERMNKNRRCTIWVNPADAVKRDLDDGDVATVSSKVGSINIEIEFTERIMPGVVSIPHGWGHDREGVRQRFAVKNPGVSVNDITDQAVVDTICGGAVFSGVPVRLDKKGSMRSETQKLWDNKIEGEL